MPRSCPSPAPRRGRGSAAHKNVLLSEVLRRPRLGPSIQRTMGDLTCQGARAHGTLKTDTGPYAVWLPPHRDGPGPTHLMPLRVTTLAIEEKPSNQALRTRRVACNPDGNSGA